MPFHIVDTEHHRFVAGFAAEDFETRAEAEARLVELLEEDPSAEGFLVVMRTNENEAAGTE